MAKVMRAGQVGHRDQRILEAAVTLLRTLYQESAGAKRRDAVVALGRLENFLGAWGADIETFKRKERQLKEAR